MTYMAIILAGVCAYIVLLWGACNVLNKRIDSLTARLDIQHLTLLSMSRHLAAVSDFTLKLSAENNAMSQLLQAGSNSNAAST